MKKTHCIYMHKNKINGKIYVGQTFQDNPNARWQNGHGYIKQPKFFSDIIKYGWINFEHIILEENLTQQEANERENFWIQYFDSCKNGYNTISENNRSEVQKKTTNSLIVCLNTNKSYKTLKEASLDTGVDPSAISRCYGGQRKSAGIINGIPGFWILTTSDKSLINKIKSNYNDAIRKIVCVETSRTFNSLDEVIEYCGLPVSSSNRARLKSILKYKTNSSFGRDKELNIKLHWSYL